MFPRNPGIRCGIIVLLTLSASVIIENVYLFNDDILGRADVVGKKICILLKLFIKLIFNNTYNYIEITKKSKHCISSY